MEIQNIKLSTWNIHGINETTGDSKITNSQVVKNYIEPFDIIGLLETWTNKESNLSLENYNYFHSFKKTNRRGGVIVYFKNYLPAGLEQIKSQSEDIIWVKLKKSFFIISNDIYVAFVYCLPISSNLYKPDSKYDTIEILREEVLENNSKGDIIINGDLNCRTADCTDFIENDKISPHFQLYDNYMADNAKYRNSKDTKIDTQGTKLLEICKMNSLRILNGRTGGDSFGEFTSYHYNGRSVVDYSIASENIIKHIPNFCVNKLTALSDHCQLWFILNVNFIHSNVSELKHSEEFQCEVKKYYWSNLSKENLITNSRSAIFEKRFKNLQMKDFNMTEDIKELENIVHEICNKSLKPKVITNKKNKPRRKAWVETNCIQMKRRSLKMTLLVR
ncbi:hypothetical protein SNE40_001636 [Patella caerulea]|uniref:Endonuclease/exonuclease/phosphatase domain-containing protein n=1 Tax=Patella caerulea TaxID=87958 RepID=A0AAN8KCY0_PATCE